MNGPSTVVYFICICAVLNGSSQSPTSLDSKQVNDLEDEIKQLPTDASVSDTSRFKSFDGTKRQNSSHLDGQAEVISEAEVESEERDDDSDEDDDDEAVETPFPAKHTEQSNIDPNIEDWDQMDAEEEDDYYEAKTNSKKLAEGHVLDDELELEKRMSRATAKFISDGHLDDSTVEELVEMLIRFAGDPEQWERTRQILEKIRYEQISTKKAKARLRALDALHQPNVSNNKIKESSVPIVSEAGNRVVAKQHRKLSSLEKQKISGKSASVKNKTKSMKPKPSKQLAPDAMKNDHFSRMLEREPYKYAIEKPVAVVGERSRAKQMAKLLEPPISQNLKAIQKEKTRLLSSTNQPTEDMEEELKTLVKMERRLKEHFKQKQKLLQQIRESNARLNRHN